MARYIDADKIDYTVTMVGMDENAGYRAVAFESDIDDMPTADVAPRAVVAREIVEIIDKALVEHEGIRQALNILIKKKYESEGAE